MTTTKLTPTMELALANAWCNDGESWRLNDDRTGRALFRRGLVIEIEHHVTTPDGDQWNYQTRELWGEGWVLGRALAQGLGIRHRDSYR